MADTPTISPEVKAAKAMQAVKIDDQRVAFSDEYALLMWRAGFSAFVAASSRDGNANSGGVILSGAEDAAHNLLAVLSGERCETGTQLEIAARHFEAYRSAFTAMTLAGMGAEVVQRIAATLRGLGEEDGGSSFSAIMDEAAGYIIKQSLVLAATTAAAQARERELEGLLIEALGHEGPRGDCLRNWKPRARQALGGKGGE